MLISKIEIRNFKGIRDLSLDLKPLTVIVGPNGSGKTSVLEAITLFAQSNGKRIHKGYVEDIVKFGEDHDMFYNLDTNNRLSLGFELKLEKNEVAEISNFLKNSIIYEGEKISYQSLIELIDELKKDPDKKQEYFSAKTIKDVLNRISTEIFQQKTIGYYHGIKIEAEREYHHGFTFGTFIIQGEFKYSITEWEINKGFNLSVSNYDVFLPESLSLFTPIYSLDFDKICLFLKRKIGTIDKSRKIYYISSNRGDFSWEHKAANKEDVGSRGENTIEIISSIYESRDFERLSDLDFFATLFGIPKVWSGFKKTGDILTSAYVDPITGVTPLKFPHLGFGSKQILPVIVQLVKNDAGTLTLIEEPEISMHPQYQIRLPFLLAHAVNKGQQLVVTTQSSYFALALGQAIQGETLTPEKYGVPEERYIKLNPKDVAVYQMTRDENGVKLDLLEFEEDGFLKRGIPTFVEVEKELFQRIFP